MDDQSMQQFVSITGATIEQAKRLLEACNGDVNMAVSMHLDCQDATSSSSGGVSTSTLVGSGSVASCSTSGGGTSTDSRTYEERHGIRAPIPQTQGVLIDQQPLLTRRNFRRRTIPKSVFDPFQDYSNAIPGGPGSTDKKKMLAELFRPPVDLMFQGDFAEARIAGQTNGKWLMVNLQDSTDFKSQTLNRDLWSDERVKQIIKDHFIFWQIQTITDEGIKFRQLYHIEEFPAIVTIDPRTGEKMEHWNYMPVNDFIAKAGEFSSLNKLTEDHLLNNNIKSVYDKSEEDQLEEAIKASLAYAQNTASQPIVLSNSSDDSDNNDDCLLSPEPTSDCSENEMEIDGTAIVSSSENSSMPVLKNKKSTVERDGFDNPGNWAPGVKGSRKRPAEYTFCDKEDESSSNRFKNPRLEPSMEEEEPHCTADSTHPRKSELSDDLEGVQINDTSSYHRKRKKKGGKGSSSSSPHHGGSINQETSSISNRTCSTANTTSVNCTPPAVGNGPSCQMLIRFPDGRRLIKCFSIEAPVKELFNCLNQEGINLSEYEVTSTFPHMIVSSLPSNTTFKDAGLCPRHTVYVQKAD